MANLRSQSGFTIVETLFAVGLVGTISAMAVPMFGNAVADFRIRGDARSLSNATALTKLRAASRSNRVRLYVDLGGRSHRIETLDRATSHWTPEGGTTRLSPQISFSYGKVTVAPPGAQATIGQAPSCTDDAGAPIANTACITFNSRGVPIDSRGEPTTVDALYVTDGMAVHGVTIASTGMIRSWRAQPVSTPSWELQ